MKSKLFFTIASLVVSAQAFATSPTLNSFSCQSQSTRISASQGLSQYGKQILLANGQYTNQFGTYGISNYNCSNSTYYSTGASSLLKVAHIEIGCYGTMGAFLRVDIDPQTGDGYLGSPNADVAVQCSLQ